MRVTLVGYTEFINPEHVPWDTDACGGQALAEFAGRACYQSWSKPNPKTATNAGYLAHILEIGHESVLEHGLATFYIEGVSRSLTHELIRHRHLSYSQLSQRYVDEGDTTFVIPPLFRRSLRDTAPEGTTAEQIQEHFDNSDVFQSILTAYNEAVEDLTEMYPEAKRKVIREAARAVLPNATETKIVVTGNYRAWRHFIKLRASEAADAEIRELAVEILRQMWGVAPNVFDDFTIVTMEDGTEVVDFADAWGE